MLDAQARPRWTTLLALCCLLLAFGCGDEGPKTDSVYLHVFNAYPGAESIDVIGESGLIASGVEFGERTEEPVAVDRNLGSEITVYVKGAPEPFQANMNLYSLYPQETATLTIIRRDESNVISNLVRHVQSISPSCRLVVNNNLSLNNNDLGNFNFMLGWDMSDNLAQAGYDEEREQNELDSEDQRPGLYTEMNRHPWFVDVPGESGDDVGMVWVGPEGDVEAPRVDFENGQIMAPPLTADYITCVEEREALREQLEQAEDEGEDVDFSQLEEFNCDALRSYTGVTHRPTGDQTEFFLYKPETVGNEPVNATDDPRCGTSHRIFSDYHNIFEGDHGYGNQNNRVDHTTEFGLSDHYFLTVYGRPVDPLIKSWRATENFAELPDYPANPESDQEEDGSGDGDDGS